MEKDRTGTIFRQFDRHTTRNLHSTPIYYIPDGDIFHAATSDRSYGDQPKRMRRALERIVKPSDGSGSLLAVDVAGTYSEDDTAGESRSDNMTREQALRWRLPSSELLDSIRHMAAEHYRSHGRMDMVNMMDASALMAIAILAQQVSRKWPAEAEEQVIEAHDI